MTAIQRRRLGSFCLAAAGSPLILLLAILGAGFALSAWPGSGEANDSPTVMIDVEVDGRCYLVPSSCSGLTTVTNVWSIGDGSITIAQDMPLHAADSTGANVPSEALVLLSTPPPRSA